MSFENLYLVFISSCMLAAYFVLYILFCFFFKNHFSLPTSKSIKSVLLVVVLSIVFELISESIPNKALSNRFLHAFGGGFLTYIVCYLVALDAKIKVTKFQFFVFSFMVVMTLGVGNEIFEYFLQMNSNLVFSASNL